MQRHNATRGVLDAFLSGPQRWLSARTPAAHSTAHPEPNPQPSTPRIAYSRLGRRAPPNATATVALWSGRVAALLLLFVVGAVFAAAHGDQRPAIAVDDAPFHLAKITQRVSGDLGAILGPRFQPRLRRVHSREQQHPRYRRTSSEDWCGTGDKSSVGDTLCREDQPALWLHL